MKAKLYFITLFIISTSNFAFSQQATWEWAKFPVAASNDTSMGFANFMATTPSGYTYRAGSYWHTFTMDNFTLTIPSFSPYNHNWDMFLVKNNSEGSPIWTKK